MSQENNDIIGQFEQLSKQIKYEIDKSTGKEQIINTHRLRNILNVISIIKKIPYKINSGSQLEDIKGVGVGTISRIDEILKTGKLKELKKSKIKDYELIIDELETVYGIGRKMAIELYKKHKITSISDLKKKHKEKKIELNDIIIKGLKYHDKIKTHIPRQEIQDIHIYLLQAAFKISKLLHIVICGSFRRLKDFSNDIDIILTNQNDKNLLQEFIQYLQTTGFIIESFTGTEVSTKYMGLCRFKNNPIRRIDIRSILYESYYFATLYFTGSKDFNKKMRQVAISKGFLLNEYGLWRNKKSIKVTSEKDIFDALGMEYLQPDKRE
jgi:DNA polymerase/3'-5' exonuclease PolX